MNPKNRAFGALFAAYGLLLCVHAYLGWWSPEFLHGRDLWHFYASRMIVPMVMLAFLASFSRVFASGLLLASVLLLIGMVSAIKKQATGEPFQVSDLFLASQGGALFGYVEPWRWIFAILPLPALYYYVQNFRFRAWSLPLAFISIAALSTYRLEPVVNFIHDYMAPGGIENLTYSRAESERMNGLGTHLYFSTAALRLKHFSDAEVAQAIAKLNAPAPKPSLGLKPDIYVILGEAWWRDPGDVNSAFNLLKAEGFREAHAISPVYGGTTPNAEFEVLTAIDLHQFKAGIIPFQHYQPYYGKVKSLARLLGEQGYHTKAYHNFTRRYWLRDQIYPAFGFESFDSGLEMGLALKERQWPADKPMYDWVLAHAANDARPEFHYIVTVSTHGAYKPKPDCGANGKTGICDYRARLEKAVKELLGFVQHIKARGRPFIILGFGDHLPGIRAYQKSIGMTEAKDPRIYQSSIFVLASPGLAEGLMPRLDGRPFTCFAPILLDEMQTSIEDPIYRKRVQQCDGNAVELLDDALVQRQLFDKR